MSGTPSIDRDVPIPRGDFRTDALDVIDDLTSILRKYYDISGDPMVRPALERAMILLTKNGRLTR